MKEQKGKRTASETSAPINDLIARLESVLALPMIAKKDFVIHHNEYKRHIKKGDDLTDVPEHYHQNLRTEGVL